MTKSHGIIGLLAIALTGCSTVSSHERFLRGDLANFCETLWRGYEAYSTSEFTRAVHAYAAGRGHPIQSEDAIACLVIAEHEGRMKVNKSP